MRQKDCHESEGTLGYMVSARPARVIEKSPVSNRNQLLNFGNICIIHYTLVTILHSLIQILRRSSITSYFRLLYMLQLNINI